MAQKEHPAVTNFRKYIKIKTVQPNPDYASCTKFLKEQARELGAEVTVMECVPGKPIVVMTLPGQDPSLPSVMLNSHTDVVPVFPQHWTHDPFSGHKDEEGNIYGRGTQDMKSVGLQYVEALKVLRQAGHTFLRTIHVTFVPDEEIGGCDGMQAFIQTDLFKKMNVGFALDEGTASPSEEFNVFYGERVLWYLWVKCIGQPGHGSQFLKNNAGEKLRRVMNSFLSFRDSEQQRLRRTPGLFLGDTTTVNLTKLKGGVQINVVPPELGVGFDIRIPPTIDVVEFERLIGRWCEEAGEGVTYEIIEKDLAQRATCTVDGQNPWWDAFSSACTAEGISLVKQIFSAGTDSRFLRELGLPALGFSPMNHTPILLHAHNEYLNEKIYLRGVDIYTSIIPALANLKHKAKP